MYYIVKHNFAKSIVGPATDWKKACIQHFGSVESTFQIKIAGASKEEAASLFDSEVGWFSPIIIGEPTTVCFNEGRLYSMEEVKGILSALAKQIKTAEEKSVVLAANEAAMPYLRVLPISAAEKFSDLYNKVLERFNYVEGNECDSDASSGR